MAAAGLEPNAENKLFVGGCPPGSSNDDLRMLFEKHGTVEEVFVMRGGSRSGMACAFVRFATQQMAQEAIDAIHGQHTLPNASEPLVVRWADAPGSRKREGGGGRRRGGGGGGGAGGGVGGGGGGPTWPMMQLQMGGYGGYPHMPMGGMGSQLMMQHQQQQMGGGYGGGYYGGQPGVNGGFLPGGSMPGGMMTFPPQMMPFLGQGGMPPQLWQSGPPSPMMGGGGMISAAPQMQMPAASMDSGRPYGNSRTAPMLATNAQAGSAMM